MKGLAKNLVLQQDQSDCGVACLATILKFHHGESSLETLRKLSGTSKQGTTLLGLMEAAQKVGFDAEGLEAEGVHNLAELNEPAILHVVFENGLQHYLVYFYQKRDHYILGDPTKGIIELSGEDLNKIWQSKALLRLTPTDRVEKKSDLNSKRRRWILELIEKDLHILLISLFLGIAIAILGISTAIFSQKLIDEILPKGNTQKLLMSLVLVSLLLIARSGFAYLRGLFMVRQGADFNNRIIQWFYNHLLQLPKSFFDTRRTGEIIARMNDTRRIQTVLSVISGSILIDLLVVVVSLGFVFSYSAAVGLIVLSSLPIYLFILLRFNKPIVRSQKEVMMGYAVAESNFMDNIQGVADIKLMNKQSFFERINTQVYGLFQNKMVDLGKLNIKFGFVSEVTGVAFLMSVFGFSSWLVLSKELKIGEMVALLSMAGNVIPAVNRLVVANIQIQEALVAFDRMFEFTAMKPEDASKPIQEEPEMPDVSSVYLHDVSFRFPGRKQILKDVSLAFKRGEMVALLGESGGGKSTLLQLIQKFYAPESGTIYIDHISLENCNTTQWRDQIGAVSQDVKIFNGHLLYNITLSDDPEVYKRAITFCEANGFVSYFNGFPQGYLTLLGEEGINLSGGQKQLVALARALFRKPKVLLLDEATSAMDRNTENFVLKLLQQEKAEMAILMITHRIKTAQRCDRIYVLQNSTIEVSGTPNELLMSDNFYSQSYQELVL